MKRIIKRILPDYIVSIIVNIQDEILSMLAYQIKKKAFRKKHNKNEKVKIAFIVHSPQCWNSIKTVYDTAYYDDKIETLVVVLPNDYINSNGERVSSLSFFQKECFQAIDAYSNGKLYDLKDFAPDIIFRQVPYEEFYPPKYRLHNLARIAKVCYIPYNYNSSPDKHLKIEYGKKMLRYLYAIFSESESNKIYLERIKSKSRWIKDLNIYNYGMPRFDLYRLDEDKTPDDSCKGALTFLWLPRWTLDEKNNTGSSFFMYKDELVSYFEQHTNLCLIIRPHPKMFANFIETGVMTENDVDIFRNKLKKIHNVKLDDNLDYLQTFTETDVLISDMSSLQTEFFLTGKPIIYSGGSNDGEYNKETEKMVNLFYPVDNWEQLKNEIEKISSGKDPNKALREREVKEFTKDVQQNIGRTIVNKCIEFA